jgi:hypothetical protein
MPGPNDTPPDITNQTVADVASLDQASAATDKYTESVQGLGSATQATAVSAGMFDSVISGAASKLSGITSLLDSNSAAFGAMGVAVLGASDKFKNFGENIDTTRLNTFTKQFKALSDIMAGSPGTQVAKQGFQAIIDQVSKLPGGMGVAADMMKTTTSAAMTLAEKFLASADNAMYAQNAMYQMAGASGQLATVMQGIPGVLTAAGNGLENINQTSAEYTNRMQSIQQSTFQTDEAFGKWSAQMSALPGGLKAIMEQSDGTTNGMNALQGAIQYATGAGLQQKDVMELMTQGMHTYNMSAKDSLQYTARAGEILNTFKDKGLMIDDVNKALKGANDTMKGFVFGPAANAANMTQNMSNAMEQYVGQLTAVGVPGEQAAEMFKNLTDKMHGLGVAQRAFLSQQTGGPGGLLGSFQMQKLMRDDPEAAQKKMQDAMKKEMGGGPMMTLDSVKTQADAAKLQKEIMMMTQGPLKMADTEEQAEAMIEAMSKGTKVDYTKDKGKFLGEAEGRGKTIEQQQMTKFGQVAMTAQSVQLMAGQTNLNTLQGALTAKTGKEGGVNGTGAGVATGKSEMRDYMDTVATRQGSASQNVMKDVSGLGSSIMPYLADAGKAMVESFKGGNAAEIKQSQATLNEQITKQRAQIAKEPDDLKKADTAKLNSYLTSLHKQTDQAPPDAGTGAAGTTGTAGRYASAGQQVGAHYTPAGQQVGAAIPKNGQPAAGKDTSGGANNALGGRGNGPVPVTLVGSGITVNFTGKCPHCNKDVKSTASAESVAPHATNKYPQG